ncbi:Probable ATP-dependent RNA helicase DHX35 [Galdieria sulphuraria]|uniref:RNA helicase n=1 Tax=Galdieria sulphuraria TaxID=130081 RepID=M2X3H9_GALSU|nr:pre-mRNA-splicing factor ATP-dependent RNA helicase [Galdieria sulphuraria]EME30955.1 pre-mRNA-splicing factor ATP-dependent RNA helicase [Galdieria sulphuraria]GJD10973.1 Probable ATP-dependent RNA helicase DHX35 [Galdieria sulphuraria]|eukprot:XP_005707475.1 pre-mRNA-splicing factor ATP-dependent RNA helicase [Galdieria sulphuraria]
MAKAFLKPGEVSSRKQFQEPNSSRLLGIGESSYDYESIIAASMVARNTSLPIHNYKEALLYAVKEYRTVVVVGETGSGKTTQIPQYLLKAGWTDHGRAIVCTQPRRIATTAVAARVAEELDESKGTLGEVVGFAVRFDNCWDSERTKILYATDGTLLRMMLTDPLLLKFQVVMLDEVHERTIATDILCGLLKKIQRLRSDLRVIISSATVDAEKFRDFFETNVTEDCSSNTAIILSVEGRSFPVDIYYTTYPVQDYLQAAYETTLEIHRKQQDGDILIFVPSSEQVDHLLERFQSNEFQICSLRKDRKRLCCVPLYSGLSYREQLATFQPAPSNERKVVVSTNIAETSVTIQGIVFVIDTGFCRMRVHSPETGMDLLCIQSISRASADQRAGRAGRSCPGKCYRLYTEDCYWKLLTENSVPEICRTNLATAILQLKAIGIENVMNFSFIDPPSAKSVATAFEVLYAIDAITEDGVLSDFPGMVMADLPMEPFLARTLVAAKDFECVREIITIIAMLQVEQVPGDSVFKYSSSREHKSFEAARKPFGVAEGDLLTLVNIYDAFEASGHSMRWCSNHGIVPRLMKKARLLRRSIALSLSNVMYGLYGSAALSKADGLLSQKNPDPSSVIKATLKGFFMNSAVVQPDGSYLTLVGKRSVTIHPSSVLASRLPKYIVYCESIHLKRIYIRNITVIEPQWLIQVAPHVFEKRKSRIEEKWKNLISE